ncbi:MAG: diguanylate cyclase [Deltaproteobacteria bacterium]|nr:diguanylate cyclase [Deltaproteobacteria bacterium]
MTEKNKGNDDSDDQTLIQPIESIDPLESKNSPALLAISGPHLGRSFYIDKDEFLVGRVDSCDLTVVDDLVSRHHCKILLTPDGAQLVDLASTNGTLLNGRRVDRVFLKEGDQVQVGSQSIFKYHMQEEVEKKFLGELFQAATKDFLTNVYNKKYFLDRLSNEFFYTQRHNGKLSVLVIDIDHFKKINDTYGHLTGDIALQKVAHHLTSHTRKDDMVARFGGEEFVILMRDCDLEQARVLAEHLRDEISKLSLQSQSNQKTFQLTVSIGVSCLSEATQKEFVKFESLLQHADNQLYKAKSEGRNRVCA